MNNQFNNQNIQGGQPTPQNTYGGQQNGYMQQPVQQHLPPNNSFGVGNANNMVNPNYNQANFSSNNNKKSNPALLIVILVIAAAGLFVVLSGFNSDETTNPTDSSNQKVYKTIDFYSYKSDNDSTEFDDLINKKVTFTNVPTLGGVLGKLGKDISCRNEDSYTIEDGVEYTVTGIVVKTSGTALVLMKECTITANNNTNNNSGSTNSNSDNNSNTNNSNSSSNSDSNTSNQNSNNSSDNNTNYIPRSTFAPIAENVEMKINSTHVEDKVLFITRATIKNTGYNDVVLRSPGFNGKQIAYYDVYFVPKNIDKTNITDEDLILESGLLRKVIKSDGTEINFTSADTQDTILKAGETVDVEINCSITRQEGEANGVEPVIMLVHHYNSSNLKKTTTFSYKN